MINVLPPELLNGILLTLALSCDGIYDLARVMPTCKQLKEATMKRNILTAANFDTVNVIGRGETLHHINGLFSKAAQYGNESAMYMLGKPILLGFSPLWLRIWNVSNLKLFVAGSTFIIEDGASCHESLHHAKLVRSFLSRCHPEDIIVMDVHLKKYLKFFVRSPDDGFCKFFDLINDMVFCYIGAEGLLRRCGNIDLSDTGLFEDMKKADVSEGDGEDDDPEGDNELTPKMLKRMLEYSFALVRFRATEEFDRLVSKLRSCQGKYCFCHMWINMAHRERGLSLN